MKKRAKIYSSIKDNIHILSKSKSTLSTVKKVLDGLYGWDRGAFEKVKRNIRTIYLTDSVQRYNTGIADKGAWITSDEEFRNDPDIPYLASLFLHEAHHIAQYRAGKRYYGKRAEHNATNVQKKFLRKIGYMYAITWLDDQLKSEWWVHMDSETKKDDKIKKEFRRVMETKREAN
jgi:hypothetical protein